ncbi:MAG: hypothetical protein U0746_22330 [Gemmataceae bacterium]
MPQELSSLTNPDVLAARAALTDRLAKLEDKAIGTIDEATGTLRETVETVRSVVDVTGSEVRDTVAMAAAQFRSVFDVPRLVSENPWQGVGLAAMVGVVVGSLRGRKGSSPVEAAQETSSSPSGGLLATLGQEVTDIGELAIRAAAKVAKDQVQTFASNLANEPVPASAHTTGNEIARTTNEDTRCDLCP